LTNKLIRAFDKTLKILLNNQKYH